MSWLVISGILVVWVGGWGGWVCELRPFLTTVYWGVYWCGWCGCVEYSGYL